MNTVIIVAAYLSSHRWVLLYYDWFDLISKCILNNPSKNGGGGGVGFGEWTMIEIEKVDLWLIICIDYGWRTQMCRKESSISIREWLQYSLYLWRARFASACCALALWTATKDVAVPKYLWCREDTIAGSKDYSKRVTCLDIDIPCHIIRVSANTCTHTPGIGLPDPLLSFCSAWVNELNTLCRQHQQGMMTITTRVAALGVSIVEGAGSLARFSKQSRCPCSGH